MVAVAQRLDRRLDNMRRRRKIRLADAKVNNVFTGLSQTGGAGEHGKGVLLTEASKRFNNLEHRLPRSFTSPYVMFATFAQWIKRD